MIPLPQFSSPPLRCAWGKPPVQNPDTLQTRRQKKTLPKHSVSSFQGDVSHCSTLLTASKTSQNLPRYLHDTHCGEEVYTPSCLVLCSSPEQDLKEMQCGGIPPQPLITWETPT